MMYSYSNIKSTWVWWYVKYSNMCIVLVLCVLQMQWNTIHYTISVLSKVMELLMVN